MTTLGCWVVSGSRGPRMPSCGMRRRDVVARRPLDLGCTMPPRRSSRLAKPTQTSQLNYDQEETLDAPNVLDSDVDYVAPRRKKKRTANATSSSSAAAPRKGKSVRKKGRLSMLPGMPLDILFDVSLVQSPRTRAHTERGGSFRFLDIWIQWISFTYPGHQSLCAPF